MRDFMILSVVALVAVVMLAAGPTGMAFSKIDYFGPEYTSSGYYGRRVMELRGASSPEGYDAGESCVYELELDDRQNCCKKLCDGFECEKTCIRMVSQRSYQKVPHPYDNNIYDT